MEVDDPQLPARIPTRGTQDTPPCSQRAYAYGAFTLYGAAFQRTSASPADIRRGPATPHPPSLTRRCSVWALPLSVAPTNGISFDFFSCGYSDASFPRVPAPYGASPKGQDCPFGNPGFYGSLRLPRAFRSLARPSSAPEPSHPPAGITAGSQSQFAPTPARSHLPQALTLPRRLSSPGAQHNWGLSAFEPGRQFAGGDPAADSPTATLLRLSPPRGP